MNQTINYLSNLFLFGELQNTQCKKQQKSAS